MHHPLTTHRRSPTNRIAVTYGVKEAFGSGVLGWARPGSDLSEEPVWGRDPAALETESLPWVRRRRR